MSYEVTEEQRSACTQDGAVPLRNVVNEEWLDKLPIKEDGEEDMLDMAFEPKQNSRLSCQLIVSDELDGLEVNIPSKQG